MPDDNGAAAPPARLEELRALVDDALRGDCAATAVWYADKLATLSRGAVEDELRLARAYAAGVEHGVPLAKQAYARGLELAADVAERLEPLRLQAEAQLLEALQKIEHPLVAPHANAETARLILNTLVLGLLVLLAFRLVGRLFRRKRKPPASSPGRPQFKPQAKPGTGKGKGKAGKRRA